MEPEIPKKRPVQIPVPIAGQVPLIIIFISAIAAINPTIICVMLMILRPFLDHFSLIRSVLVCGTSISSGAEDILLVSVLRYLGIDSHLHFDIVAYGDML